MAKTPFGPSHLGGVRDFGAQLRHVAATNFHLAAAILGEKPPAGSEHDIGPDNLKTKAENIQYLKDSFAYLHKAMLSITEKNMLVLVPSPCGGNQTTRLRIAVLAEGHPYDQLWATGGIRARERHHSTRQPRAAPGKAGEESDVIAVVCTISEDFRPYTGITTEDGTTK